MRTIAFAVAVSFAAPAFAAGTFEIVDAKITSAIDGKEAIDNKVTFATGEKAYVWMKIRPSGDKPMLRIKYSAEGNHIWTMDPVEARLGRLWYYKTLDIPGAWKAEIIDEADAVIKALDFTVTGEPVQRAAAGAGTATATATATATGDAVVASTHLSVVELKLAVEIKDREPVSPTTTFTTGSKVYAWLKLNVTDPETQVKLRWSLAKKPVYTSEAVTVKQSPGWRTWLYKTADIAGEWAVEVLDAEDKVVHKVDFNVN